MRKLLYICLLCLIALCSCQPQGITDLSSFVADDTVRLEIDGQTILRYDEMNHQLAYNEMHCEFRLQTDTMLDYFVLTLSEIPGDSKTGVAATLIWSTSYGERTKEITLFARRIKGDLLWLSDESCRYAVVVRILE